MATDGYKLFGQRLVGRGVITQQQLDEALARQRAGARHRKVGEILVTANHISRSQVAEELSNQLGVPIVKLSDWDIPERIRSLVDGNIATLYRIVPVALEAGTLVVATADPTNITTLDNLPRLLDRPVNFVTASPEEISAALAKYYGLSETTARSILDDNDSTKSLKNLNSLPVSHCGNPGFSGASNGDSISVCNLGYDEGDWTGQEEDDTKNPVVRYVHDMVVEAFRLRASDIHVEPGKTEIKVRFRIDGVMHETVSPPKRAQAAIISRIKLLAGMDIAEKRLPQDGRIKLSADARTIDIRVSTLPGTCGENIVMRILDKAGVMLGLDQLGFSPEDQQAWERLMRQATGVVLVTGPTGSGKTTTLYASLNALNQPGVKMVTVEDPVEYQLNGINQIQIQHEIGWDFSCALRAIFRQDPDIVMVGEVRDKETAEMAIKAALTGHLVFSTLHTNDSAGAFVRLIDIGLKPFLVASGVAAILGQRLIRTICPNCREPYKPPEEEFEILAMRDIDPGKIELFHGAGCQYCGHTGYSGRIGAYELLETNDAIRQMVLDGASAGALRRQARIDGMKTMREDAWAKALKGITTIEEVNRKTRADEPLKLKPRSDSQLTGKIHAPAETYPGLPTILWPL